ncbi:MAG TPA: TIR domain-containing protein [Chloroflexota bacterium]|nr:TIR domain-containing protein [Chloroflexota bacterium]
MADVFLSYARGDRSTAERLAHAISEAGLTVWWDRHIKGGAEFSPDIERQLDAAARVLVLWSKEAVQSRWVRDEATVAADSGRLVGATIDGTPPPLGFRQFHTINLKAWAAKGAVMPAELAEALDVEAPAPAKPAAKRRLMPAAAAALVITALIAAGAWLFWGRDAASAAETPTLAVLPFADLSPQRDKAYFSEGVAEEILSVLARDPGIRVIGRSSSRQFQDSSSDLQGIRKALGVTHVLEGSARTFGDELRMSVRLIDASDGSQVWAENYQRKMSNVFAVQAEIGREVAQRLSGSLSRELRQAKPQSTGVDTYTLYLAARAKMRERTEPALKDALRLARQVIAADPNYAPGHALFAELTWLLTEENYGDIPIEQGHEAARRHALRAINLAPDQSEGYAALGTVPPFERAVAALRKAIELDPSRGELRLWLAGAMFEMGKNEAALEQQRAAVAMEPIWAPAVRNLANALAASGRYEEAERVTRDFESRGGEPAQAAQIRAGNAWMKGDLSEAVRYLEAVIRARGELFFPESAALYHDLGLFARAASLVKNDPRLRLFVSGKYRELAQLVQRDGLWEQPSAWFGLEALAATRNWGGIERFYDERPASARNLCQHSVGPQGRIHLATALKERGRDEEARPLLDCVRNNIRLHSTQSIRPFRFAEWNLAALSAQVFALEGNKTAAFREMNRAYRLGLATPHSLGLSVFPAFDAHRATGEYRELDALFKQRTAAERQQFLRQ